MNIPERVSSVIRPRLFANIAAAGFAVLILAGWCSPGAVPPEDPLARRDVGRQAPVAEIPDEAASSFDPRMMGLVVDAVTGKPLPGAVGTIDGKAFATDVHGCFALPGGPADAIRDVFVAVNGYRSLSFRWNPELRPELKLSLKQFRAPVDIRVLTASGTPAPGIALSLPDAPECLTDEDGMARLRSVRPGYHQLRVAGPAQAPETMLLSVAENGGVHTVRLPASFMF